MFMYDSPTARCTRYLVDTLGFEKHVRQIRERRGDPFPNAWYERPYFYALRIEKDKMRGSGQTIRYPSYVKKKDYEFELVALFLEPIKTTDPQEAVQHMRHKMAFAIMNDCSCRDIQADDTKIPLGVAASKGVADKAFSSSWAYGRDLNMDANGVFHRNMELRVNGEVRCENRFDSIYFKDPRSGKQRNWSFAEVIAWFGRMNQGFEQGDLLGSGTVGNGCIAEWSDIYPWLESGDEIVMAVEGLGELRNTVEVIDMPNSSRCCACGTS